MGRKGGVPALLGHICGGSGMGAGSADSFLPDLSLAQTPYPWIQEPNRGTFLGKIVQVGLDPTSRATSLGLRDTRDI